MASSSYAPTTPTKNMAISSLLSPEETRPDSFTSPMVTTMTRTPASSFSSQRNHSFATDPMSIHAAFLTGDAYPSPPIGDYDPHSQKENNDRSEEDEVRDPPLFKANDTAALIDSDLPLFPPLAGETVNKATQLAIVAHMNSPSVASLPAKPSTNDYELVATFFSEVIAASRRIGGRAWYAQEREYAKMYGSNANRVAKSNSAVSKPYRNIAPKPAFSSRKQKTQLPRPSRAVTKPKRTPQTRVYDSFVQVASPSPKPAKLATNRDDTDYNALPDFSPPNTLAPNSKTLHADWKGQKLDLSNDPDRHLIHENEVNLASTLRLSCATYLCSKRRIFQSRIDALRIGKEFRKTDAQQACKIDVNKASKLWTAYEKVGWFRKEHFIQHL
ncbi:SWIRM domain-containing protein FUN19 [Lophium mytilinum]|uniref:SWIRM domain-containing protein FUN19 n=1 Tax=Lophium mytilinum TaxID=390894 RepID=A0A6A6QHT5_9PEZI|nr:SWIRM domain-containing protein FUN19 [Lophium mytilinum]